MVIVILDIVLFISPLYASRGGAICEQGGMLRKSRGGAICGQYRNGILCFYIEGNSLRHFLTKMHLPGEGRLC